MANKPLTERKKVMKLHPFHHTLHIIVSSNIHESVKKHRFKLWEGQTTGTSYAFTLTSTSSFDIYVFLPELCGLGATAHEMFHALHFMLQQAGVEFEEELYAHWVQYLTQVGAEFVHTERRKPRKKKGKNVHN
jgi:hypothetical protein